jgi:cyclopropane-fatty-acyl-phospholipid synthase
MWVRIFDKFLRHLIRDGDLTVTFADGHVRRYGNGKGPAVAITLHDAHLPRRIVLSPDMAVGEGYMDGRLTIEDDDVHGFLSLAIRNISAQGQPWYRRPLEGLRRLKRRLDQFNPVARARANVAHHYDLSGELYDLFLDEDRNYSCAYFRDPSMTLEEAQEAKKRHIAGKLLIEPGMKVLDIGCGWGGMGLTLARDYCAEVTGVTLSEEQHAMANARAEKAGLSDKARFHLMDYRDVEGQFDRIVSIGMFEHVGVPHYSEYFKIVRELLDDNGVALIHSIGRIGPSSTNNAWINKYIFPGSHVPTLTEAVGYVDHHAMVISDIEVLRTHYAHTLDKWYNNFTASNQKIDLTKDERFVRMWKFYLASMATSFRHGRLLVYQIQLSKKFLSVPITRDYLYQTSNPVRKSA